MGPTPGAISVRSLPTSSLFGPTSCESAGARFLTQPCNASCSPSRGRSALSTTRTDRVDTSQEANRATVVVARWQPDGRGLIALDQRVATGGASGRARGATRRNSRMDLPRDRRQPTGGQFEEGYARSMAPRAERSYETLPLAPRSNVVRRELASCRIARRGRTAPRPDTPGIGFTGHGR